MHESYIFKRDESMVINKRNFILREGNILHARDINLHQLFPDILQISSDDVQPHEFPQVPQYGPVPLVHERAIRHHQNLQMFLQTNESLVRVGQSHQVRVPDLQLDELESLEGVVWDEVEVGFVYREGVDVRLAFERSGRVSQVLLVVQTGTGDVGTAFVVRPFAVARGQVFFPWAACDSCYSYEQIGYNKC